MIVRIGFTIIDRMASIKPPNNNVESPPDIFTPTYNWGSSERANPFTKIARKSDFINLMLS